MQNPIGKWISPLYRYRKSFMARRLEPYGAASRLFMMLLEISRNDGMNQEQISSRLKIDKAAAAIEEALAQWGRLIRAGIPEEDYLAAEAVLHKTAANACRRLGALNEK